MEYTVQRLASLAGISARTLRYYDRIGLLEPARVTSSGYRIYGAEQVDALQQILFYRELDIELSEIKQLMSRPDYDRTAALKIHLAEMTCERARLDRLIHTLKLTINTQEGDTKMTDAEKFDGFKQKLIDENEKKYGEEIREKYGEERVNESNRKLMKLTNAEYNKMNELATELQALIERAVNKSADPAGSEGSRAYKLHKEWLSFSWPDYSLDAHKGLTQMYVDDERFKSYYDKNLSGCAQFLRDAVHAIEE